MSQLSECVLPRPRVDRVEKGPRLSLPGPSLRVRLPETLAGEAQASSTPSLTWKTLRGTSSPSNLGSAPPCPAPPSSSGACSESSHPRPGGVPDNCNLQCWTWITEQSTVCRRRPDADRRDSHGFARRDGFLGHIPNGLRTWFGVARWNWVARGLRGPHWSRIVPSHRVWHARLTRAAVSGVAVTRGFVCFSLRSVVLMDNSKCARTKK